jgi:hypothetical protein
MKKSIRNLSTVTTIGLDIAKNVFQSHGVDAAGFVVVAKSVRRAQVLAFFASLPPCLVGIEACSSARATQLGLSSAGYKVLRRLKKGSAYQVHGAWRLRGLRSPMRSLAEG